MKRVLNVGIGGRSFVIDEDAFMELDSYLEKFRSKVGMGYQTKEVMDDLEMRIAELFMSSLSSQSQVVTIDLVRRVIDQLGMPDGSSCSSSGPGMGNEGYQYATTSKKLFRDSDNKVIGGVCSGLAAYFGLDIILVRVILLVMLLFAFGGFWLYLILWIVVPEARTAADKCRMRGWPVTAENMNKFYRKY